MEIRMKTLMAGPNGSRHPGEKCTVSAEEAEMLIAGGYAEPAEAEKVDETPAEETTAEADEPAEAEKGNRKGKGK